MDKQTVRALLNDLHAALESSEDISVEDRTALGHIVEDIQALLRRSNPIAAHEHRPTIQQLQEAARRFEVSHPQLTAVIAQVVNSLSDIGI